MQFTAFLSRMGPIICVLSLPVLLISCSATQNTLQNKSGSAASLAELRPEETTQLVNKPVTELLTSGNIYLEKRNPGLAKLHFATALEKQPESAEAFLGLGRIELHSGNYPAALNLFSRAAEIDKTLVEALVGQSQALRFSGKMDAAVKKINEAMALSPNDVLVLREVAILYDLTGQEKLAESLYVEIVRMTPDVAASHNNFGMNLLVQQKYPQAILSFLQALNINRESVRIRNNLAIAYALNGNTEKALRLFADTVGEASAHNNLGYLYMTQGKLELAEEHLKRAIAIHPKYYPKAQENLARLKQAKRAKRLK